MQQYQQKINNLQNEHMAELKAIVEKYQTEQNKIITEIRVAAGIIWTII